MQSRQFKVGKNALGARSSFTAADGSLRAGRVRGGVSRDRFYGRFYSFFRTGGDAERVARGYFILPTRPDARMCIGLSARAHDTFIDPVASNVYESLFESEDESADARQVHGRLKRSSISARAFDAHYQAFFFHSAARYMSDPFGHDGSADTGARPAFLICFGLVWDTPYNAYIYISRDISRQDWTSQIIRDISRTERDAISRQRYSFHRQEKLP